jgi:hypothetical protein
MRKSVKSVLMAAMLGAAVTACATIEDATTSKPAADAREGLAPGFKDAEEAIWNLKLVQTLPSPPGFAEPDALWAPRIERAIAQAIRDGKEVERPPNPISFANTDLAFSGDHVIMGNFHGFNVFKADEEGKLEHALSVVCPGGQGDVSVHGDLVFYSVEQNRARLDCGAGGVEGQSSAERFRGVRIFDISDLANPQQVAAVQTCRGSHTHTIVPHPTRDDVLYIYNSATSGVRPATELEGCSDGQPEENPDTSLYSIDIIKVPLDAPEEAALISSPRIFADRETGKINSLWKGGALEEGAQRTSQTNHCHDITVYPAFNLAAGACSGNGILLDISDPENPSRIHEISDPNMAYWHAAVFDNDATKVLFTDEWGGGLGARCQPQDPEKWGANIIADIEDNMMVPRGFFKIPNVQTASENCVAHNGSLIPVPGRDILVQGWYSGGISVIDFTDTSNPVEIAYFDRGPVDADELYLAGHWAAYWHNGRIYGTEIVRGLDVFKLVPSDMLSKSEIKAAKLIQFEEANTQTQERFEWPAKPVVAQAYIDQLMRDDALDAGLLDSLEVQLVNWQNGTTDADEMAALVANLQSAGGQADGETAVRLAALADVFARAK